MNKIDASIAQYSIERYSGSQSPQHVDDPVAVEEPLEIRLRWTERQGHGGGGEIVRTLALTMRTPGHDADLAAGFLLSEGVIANASEIAGIGTVGLEWLPGETANALEVMLADGVAVDFKRLERNFYTSSSCGVCGKTSIESVRTVAARAIETLGMDGEPLVISQETITALPERLRAAQRAFDQTGGLHASALFTPQGELILAREDVGRHNALDKLIGAELLAGHLPLSASVLLVSGRASFELVQKAVMAGIPILAAVGAPSSLAVDLAREFGVTLIGFLRGERFNVYSAPERVV